MLFYAFFMTLVVGVFIGFWSCAFLSIYLDNKRAAKQNAMDRHPAGKSVFTQQYHDMFPH